MLDCHPRLVTPLFAFSVGVLAAIASAHAQTSEPPPYQFAEVRLGVLAHDVGGPEGGADLNGEITSSSLLSPSAAAWAPSWARFLFQPRAHLGGEVSLAGRTSQLYVGLTWTTALAERILSPQDAVEFSFLFGPSLNNGDRQAHAVDRVSLGSNILFHLGTEIAYRFSPTWAVGVYFDHSSNAGFVRQNAGINELGARLAYRF